MYEEVYLDNLLDIWGKIYEKYVWVLCEKWILYDVKKYKRYCVES